MELTTTYTLVARTANNFQLFMINTVSQEPFSSFIATDRYIVGPIVRLWPNHLHIRDVDAYSQQVAHPLSLTRPRLMLIRIYKIGAKFDKHAIFYSNPVIKGSFFTTSSNKDAVARRSMHSPFLSKEAVRRSEYMIQEMLVKFMTILSGYASDGRPVDLSYAFRSVAGDMVMNFTFQRPLNALDAEGFQSELLTGLDAWNSLFQWPTYFPRFFAGVAGGVASLPKWVIDEFVKPFALVYRCLEVIHHAGSDADRAFINSTAHQN